MFINAVTGYITASKDIWHL